jgi:penicillin-binding protein 2
MIEADEVFLDTKNLPHFNKERFEGKLEKPISKHILSLLLVSTILISCVFIARLYYVQIVQGQGYFTMSTQNALDQELVFASRGIIYDRAGKKLAWNEDSPVQDSFLLRKYSNVAGLSHILGYVKYPKQDKKGYFWRTEYVGIDGIEKQYNETLSGKNGARIIETNVSREKVSSNVYEKPIPGSNVTLSIDSELQGMLYKAVGRVVADSSYVGGAGGLVDLDTGEILASVSYPEYDSNIMTESTNESVISGYFQNSRHPLLNRMISGLYTPGSIVKPFVGIGALTEGVITPDTRIASHGTISIPNPYNRDLKTVFRDFRPDNGVVNIKEALSVSSNIFFYNVGGGYQNQKGIGIDKIGYYLDMFDIGKKTHIELPGETDGLIPSQTWKAKTFPNDPTWRLGDTYNTAIGQYGVQVTPIQMLQGVSTIATGGTKIPFTFIKKDTKLDTDTLAKLPIRDDVFTTIHQGMRLAVTSPLGTGKGLYSGLPINFAVKTGTAQVGARNEYINTWIIGFFPYEKPRYAFVILMDKGSDVHASGAPTAARFFFEDFIQSDFYTNSYTK